MKNILINLGKAILLICAVICIGFAVFLGYKKYNSQITYFVRQKLAAVKQTKSSASVSQAQIEQQKEKSAEQQKKQLEQQQKAAADKKQQDLENLWQQGYNEYNAHHYEQCIHIEDQVIAEDPNFYKAYTIKGIAQCFSNNYDEGIVNLDKALQIKPDYGYGRYAKALAFELYAHYDEALAEYNSALEIENYVWSYYGIASIYGRRGDIDNVVKYLKIAISLNPAVKECAKTEEDYDNVRKYKEFQDLINN